jgi:hypothetical protein
VIDTQERITLILGRITGTALEPRALALVEQFRQRALKVARCPMEKAQQLDAIERMREMLHASLCELLAPLNLDQPGPVAGDVDQVQPADDGPTALDTAS